MGGKKKNNADNYFNVLKNCSIFTPTGNIKTFKSALTEWETASKLINSKIKPITVYLYVSSNTQNIKSRLQDFFLLNNRQNGSEKNECKNSEKVCERSAEECGRSEEECENSEEEYENSEEGYENSEEYKNEETDGSAEENYESVGEIEIEELIKKAKIINPQLCECEVMNEEIDVEEMYAKDILPDEHKKLPVYLWTNSVIRLLSEKIRIKCPYSFKKGQAYTRTPDKYFDFQGTCPVCANFIYGVCKQKPVDGKQFKLNITTLNTDRIIHVKKRRFFGKRRRDAMSKLKYMTAYQLRTEMINDHMEFNDYVPPDIPSLEVLRKVKQEAIDDFIKLDGPKEPIHSLIYLSNHHKFLKKVVAWPFQIWYHHDEQDEIWDKVADINPVIVVDATGSLMHNVVSHETKSSHLMLYQLLSWFEDDKFDIIKNEYAPLDQLISTKQDTNTVRNWIGHWARRIKKHPRETITDCSLVLLNALSLELNHCSYKEYQIKCLNYLQSDGKVDPGLKTFIRLDRAHLINSICKWKVWKDGNNIKKKTIYTRIFGYALTITNFHEMKQLISAAFFICQSKSYEENSSTDKLIKWLTKQFTEPEEDNNSSSVVNSEDYALENSTKDVQEHFYNNNMVDFISHLQNKSEEQIENNDSISVIANFFWLPKIKKNLVLLFSQFPSYSLVMQKYFSGSNDAASTARSESYNKDLKINLGLKSPISVNKFVLWHGLIVQAQAALCMSSMKEFFNLQLENNVFKKQDKFLKEECEDKFLKEECEDKFLEEVSEDKFLEEVSEDKFLKEDIILPMDFTNEDNINFINFTKSFSGANSTKNDVDIVDHNNEVKTEEKKLLDFKTQERKVIKKPINNKKKTPEVRGCLRNGANLEPKKVNSVSKQLVNTCGFDTITEILCQAIKNSDKFKSYIHSHIKDELFLDLTCYASALLTYAEKGPKGRIYAFRAYILDSLFQSKYDEFYGMQKIDAFCNIEEHFSTLMNNYPNITSVQTCHTCQNIITKNIPTIFIPNTGIVINHYLTLEQELKNMFTEKQLRQCKTCKGKTATRVLQLGIYLWIQTEVAYCTTQIQTNINEIPLSLEICDTKYVLNGVAEYRPGHYVAWCRDSSGEWQELNDMNQKKTVPNELTIASIFYVQS